MAWATKENGKGRGDIWDRGWAGIVMTMTDDNHDETRALTISFPVESEGFQNVPVLK